MFAGQFAEKRIDWLRDMAAFCGLMKLNCSFWVKGPQFVRWPSNAARCGGCGAWRQTPHDFSYCCVEPAFAKLGSRIKLNR